MNARRKKFCQEYILDFNATQAALRAGYAPHAAKSQASKLLTFIDVANYINHLMDGVTERAELTADSVLANIADIRRSCEGTHPAVALKACELEAKYLGILTDRVEHSGNIKVEGEYWVNFTDKTDGNTDPIKT